MKSEILLPEQIYNADERGFIGKACQPEHWHFKMKDRLQVTNPVRRD
jgi:hypothetical protein